jgi:hypothetical protein
MNTINVPVGGQIKPFEPLLDAISIVESGKNNLALNEEEGAYGALQVRQVRLDHYFQLTGKRYGLTDMYDYEKAKEVFIYFAMRIGDNQFEQISKRWNGSGPLTEIYWNKVKALL